MLCCWSGLESYVPGKGHWPWRPTGSCRWSLKKWTLSDSNFWQNSYPNRRNLGEIWTLLGTKSEKIFNVNPDKSKTTAGDRSTLIFFEEPMNPSWQAVQWGPTPFFGVDAKTVLVDFFPRKPNTNCFKKWLIGPATFLKTCNQNFWLFCYL